MRSLLFVILVLGPAHPAAAQDDDPRLWTEEIRRFIEDGPGWLIPDDERRAFLEATDEERTRRVADFFQRDPDAGTTLNELREGVVRRRRLVEVEHLSYQDVRSRLLFLHGQPHLKEIIGCDQTFVPMEVWWFGDPETNRGYVVYEPGPDAPYKIWLPLDSKRVLYHHEMEYWLEQVAEVRGAGRGPRFDRQLCKKTKLVDEVTGVKGLFGFEKNRPKNEEILKILEPPRDLEAWARAAAAEPLGEEGGRLLTSAPEVFFPEMDRQRMVTRILVRIPREAGLQVYEDNEKREVRVKVEGLVERGEETFEEFHMRFQVPVEGDPDEFAIVVDRLLRPEDVFLVRMKIIDEISDAEITKSIAFRVPEKPEEDVVLPTDILVAHGRDSLPEVDRAQDTLFLIPPRTDVVLGLWRAETLVTGAGIVKVVFFLDEKPQFTRSRPPFHAELRLTRYPTEQVVRVEGYDATGEILASDEVVLNQQRGRLEIRIIEPGKGSNPTGTVLAKAGIVVPEEKVVQRLEFLVNDAVKATLESPPWEAQIEVPPVDGSPDINYLTAAVYLDDGTRAEEVLFLNQPEYLEEVEVDFVELYTSVTGDDARSLKRADFTVLEDKRPQVIEKFELVEDLPITIGLTLDTSGSMIEALDEAKRTVVGFLDNIVTPKDQSFLVSFSNRPSLVMPRTSDVGAVEASLEGLRAVGNTSLYDAIITSLYYFRGVRGRRALVLLSDGDDTTSSIDFKDALEYARRSGVVIYSIGLNIPKIAVGLRSKLDNLSDETGGRSFFISNSTELQSVYGAIERELRSQYLLAYLSDAPQESEAFRTVQVKVKGRLKARTTSGYYP